MDRLEAVELKLSESKYDNNTFRLDSEYFKKEYLLIDNIIEKNKIIKLNLLSDWITQGSNPRFSEDGIPCLTGRNVKSGIVKYENSDFVNLDEYNLLKRFQIKINDILITLKGKGSIGKIGFVTDTKQAIFSRDIGLIRVNNNKTSPILVYLFLISKYGTKIIEKGETGGTGQSTLTTTYLKNINIPVFSDDFIVNITQLIDNSNKKLEDSKTLYKQAEALLLKKLDLIDYNPSGKKVAIKTFTESFGVTGRLDSEYYQPKFDEIVNKIKTTKYDSLKNIVDINKSVEPGSEAYQDNGIPFIRVSNLTKFGLSEPDIHLSQNLFDKETLEKLQPKKDTILLSKDGTVGIAYNIKEDSNIITSGAILHLTIKSDKVLPEYLTLVLNSIVVQMQSQRDAGGSIIKHWKPSEIAEILIPIIDNTIQFQIEEKIKESFKLQKESQELLEVAKRAVEIAIEKDEEVAIKYIEESKNE